MTVASPTDGSVGCRCVCSRRRAQTGERSTGTCPRPVLRVTVGLGIESDLLRGRQKETGGGKQDTWYEDYGEDRTIDANEPECLLMSGPGLKPD